MKKFNAAVSKISKEDTKIEESNVADNTNGLQPASSAANIVDFGIEKLTELDKQNINPVSIPYY